MVSELKTRCPHCQTVFRVSDHHLEAAAGMVRCGKCLNAFNGVDHLLEKPSSPVAMQAPDDDFLIDDDFDISRLDTLNPPAPAATSPPPPGTPLPTVRVAAAPARDDNPATSGHDSVEPVVFTAGNPVPAAGTELGGLVLDKRDMFRWRPETHNIIPDAGLIGRRPSRPRDPRNWLWAAGSLVAALALALQLLYFNSLGIPRDSPLWGLSARLCPTLGCPLPAVEDRGKILSTNLVIRSHPEVAGALLVDAVIVNNADFDQPFPPLTLSFENLQGETVARRTFVPDDYLMGELAGLTDMPAGRPVKLELEIVDPGRDAVSFQVSIAR